MKLITYVFSFALVYILVGCAPAVTLGITKGSSPFGRLNVISTRGFLVGDIEGVNGTDLRQRLLIALEKKSFDVVDANAAPLRIDADFAISGIVRSQNVNQANTSISNLILRISSRNDGQMVRLFELQPGQRLSNSDIAELVTDGIMKEFKPTR